MWDSVKIFFVTVTSAVFAYLEPINNVMSILFLLAGIDIFFGVITGIAVEQEKFRFKKFILSAIYVFIYLGIVTLIYTIGRLQDDFNEAMFIVKTITYIFIYFYTTNIFKNIYKLMPNSRAISFLVYIIDLEFAHRIPQLDKFIKREKEHKETKIQKHNG